MTRTAALHTWNSKQPALVGISHGTSSQTGQTVVQQLMGDTAQRLDCQSPGAGPETRLGHVDVQQPNVRATLDNLPQSLPAVVVPPLLSAGFHITVDLRSELDDVGPEHL